MRLPPNTAQLLRDAGLKVVEIPGWQARSRPASTGGFEPHGVLWHHTGASDKRPHDLTDDREYAGWLATIGRSDLPAPLCHFSVGRDGTWYVIAAGRANHAGRAKATGPMPAGDGNTMYAGVECQNNGTEGWTKTQYESMVTGGAVLTSKAVRCGVADNRAHRETSLTGKWDPGALDMSRFRADIAAAVKGRREPPMNNVQKGRIHHAQMIAAGKAAIEDYSKATGRPAVAATATILRYLVKIAERRYAEGPKK